MSEWNRSREATLKAAIKKRGHHDFGTAGMKYEHSRLFVLFADENDVRQIDITDKCRERFGRLDAYKRAQIEAYMPDTIGVDVRFIEIKKKSRPNYFGGVKFFFSIDEQELADWIKSVQL